MNYEIFSAILPLPTIASAAAICSASIRETVGRREIYRVAQSREKSGSALNYEEKERKDTGNVLCFCASKLVLRDVQRNLSTIDHVIETRVVMTYVGDKN